MKSGRSVVRAIMMLLFLAALAYFGAYAYRVFLGGFETATVYSYMGENMVPAEGYVIRKETVLSGGGSLEEIIVAEGENVAMGDTVARIYRSQSALEQRQELDRLQEELARLEYIRERGTEESEAIRLNQEIVDAIAALHANTSMGKLNAVDRNVDELKDMVFRRDYTYSTGSALNAQISDLTTRIVNLQNATESAVSTINASSAGIFSAMVDGYERCFDLENIKDLTPALLRQQAGRKTVVAADTLGKVVTSFTWYYAAIMSEDDARYLSTGNAVTVHFASSSVPQAMQVAAVSTPDENGELLVLFSSMNNLSETTSLREESAQIAYGSYTGFRVPKGALHFNEDGDMGVYRVSGTRTEWLNVELIFTGPDYYLVKSADKDNMTQLDEARKLHQGDEVLVRGKGLYSGKVIE